MTIDPEYPEFSAGMTEEERVRCQEFELTFKDNRTKIKEKDAEIEDLKKTLFNQRDLIIEMADALRQSRHFIHEHCCDVPYDPTLEERSDKMIAASRSYQPHT